MRKLLDLAGVSKKVRVPIVAAVLAEKAVPVLVAACVLLAALSGYRAYFQVRGLELEKPEGVLGGGSAVRATATGRPQWLRTPPPEVREAAVEIRHEGQAP